MPLAAQMLAEGFSVRAQLATDVAPKVFVKWHSQVDVRLSMSTCIQYVAVPTPAIMGSRLSQPGHLAVTSTTHQHDRLLRRLETASDLLV